MRPRRIFLFAMTSMVACSDPPPSSQTDSDTGSTTNASDASVGSTSTTTDVTTIDPDDTGISSSGDTDQPPAAVDDRLAYHEELGIPLGTSPADNDTIPEGSYLRYLATSANGAEVVPLTASGSRFRWSGSGSLADDVVSYDVVDAERQVVAGADVLLGIVPMTFDLEDLRDAGEVPRLHMAVGRTQTFMRPLGDFSGDGVPDLLIHTPDATFVVQLDAAGFPPLANILDGTAALRINGLGGSSDTNWIGPAGDIDGDGLADLVIDLPAADAVVVFGRAAPGVLEADGLTLDPANLVLIHDVDTGAGFGDFVAANGVGDVNGDGLDDLALGNSNHSTAEAPEGRVYVVHGRGPGVVLASDIAAGAGGFVIDSAPDSNSFGLGTWAAGDANADGYADLAIRQFGTVVETTVGAYVVFGGPGTAPVSVAGDDWGYRVYPQLGRFSPNWFPTAVQSIGDFDGDGADDLAIAAGYFDQTRVGSEGRVWIVWGKGSYEDVSLTSLEANGTGVTIDGFAEIRGNYDIPFSARHFGEDVASLGDLDGDGHADIAVYANRVRRWNPGGLTPRTYIITGRPRTEAIEIVPTIAGIGGFALVGGRDDITIDGYGSRLAAVASDRLAIMHGEGLTAINVDLVDPRALAAKR